MLLESRPAGGLWRSQLNVKLFQPKAISVGCDRCKVFPGFNCNFGFNSLTLPMQSQSHQVIGVICQGVQQRLWWERVFLRLGVQSGASFTLTLPKGLFAETKVGMF